MHFSLVSRRSFQSSCETEERKSADRSSAYPEEVKLVGQPSQAETEPNWPPKPPEVMNAQCVYVYTGFQKDEKDEKAMEEIMEVSLDGEVYICEGDEKTVKEKLSIKLLPGEKHGWWSSNLPDKRHLWLMGR